MKKKFLFILLFFLSSFYFNLNAQCPAPEKLVRSSNKGNFTTNKQSKSGALIPGESYEHTFNAQEGNDYRIMSGADGRGKIPIPFEVIEIVTEKDAMGEFKKVRKVINSSTGDEPITFKCDKTSVLIVKVSLPSNEIKKPECVAILIEDRKSSKIGF